jgi:hypothetical protein
MSAKKTSIKYIFFVLFFVFFALGVKWGVSNADSLSILDIVKPQEVIVEQNFSAAGVVSNIATIFDTNTYIYMENSSAPDGLGRTAFGFSTDQVRKIENTDYLPLTIDDIKVGDKIVVQGLLKNGVNIEVYRIISFAPTANKEKEVETATSTESASTTPNIELASTSTASTSDLFASSSDDTSTTTEDVNPSASSSEGILNTISDTVKDVIQAVVDVFSGGSDANPPAEEVSPKAESTPEPTPVIAPEPAPVIAPEPTPVVAPEVTPAPVSTPSEQ